MADKKTKQLKPSILQDDLDAYAALKDFPDYKPANDDFILANGEALKTTKEDKQTADIQAQAKAKAARDDSVAAEWDFHEWVLGAKDQVRAQYGPNSNQLQALGLKKKSEYKSKSSNKAKT